MRVPDRDDELTDAKRLRLAEHRGLQAVRFRAQHREVGQGIAADDPEPVLASVGERRPARGRAIGDDVRGGQQEAVGGEHDGAARAGRGAAAAAALHDAQVRDRRGELLRDGDDDPRVRVERLRLLFERDPSHRLLQRDGDLSLVERAHDGEIEARACAIEDAEEVVERLERLPRRRDEQIAALEAGAVGGTPLLDRPDEQARALGQADRASHLPRRVRRRERDPQLAVLRALAAPELLDA